MSDSKELYDVMSIIDQPQQFSQLARAVAICRATPMPLSDALAQVQGFDIRERNRKAAKEKLDAKVVDEAIDDILAVGKEAERYKKLSDDYARALQRIEMALGVHLGVLMTDTPDTRAERIINALPSRQVRAAFRETPGELLARTGSDEELCREGVTCVDTACTKKHHT